jgi:hypothetical protein
MPARADAPVVIDPMGVRRTLPLSFVAAIAFVALVAWILRAWFVVATQVEAPIRGDVREYVAYAWNMVHHGVFSRLDPGTLAPPPDAYRGPGYPAFLALALASFPDHDRWYWVALHAQALLGALTCVLTTLTARLWLGPRAALLAGSLLALWPHHIAASGALLSEVVLGALLSLAIWLVCRIAARGGVVGAVPAGMAGLAFALAALVNLVMLPLALLAAAWLAWRLRSRNAVWIALLPILLVAAWQVRNQIVVAADEPARNRALVNLVQGSWPLYHAASNDRQREPMAASVMQAIEDEERLISADPVAGLASIMDRIAHDPPAFASWYLLEKPYLLWDWSIRIGAGDVYFHRVQQSPLESSPVLHPVKRGFEVATPWLFAIGLAFVGLVALGPGRRPARFALPSEFIAIALLCLTAIHVVLQAEPRYSIPYRSLQSLAVASMVALLFDHFGRRLRVASR